MNLFKNITDNSNINANIQNDVIRKKQEISLKSLRAFYRVGLTYSSNAIEGNSLTETETKVVIEDGLTVGGKPLLDVLRL